MFQNLGDILNYLILIGIGISMLFAYRKSKKTNQLWSGVVLIAVGVIWGAISLNSLNNTKSRIDITKIIKKTELSTDTIGNINRYKNIINLMLNESVTLKNDSIISFLKIELSIPKGARYVNEEKEPSFLLSDSSQFVFVSFKKENNSKNKSFKKVVNSTVNVLESLKGGVFPDFKFTYDSNGSSQNIKLYSVEKKLNGIPITNGKTLFIKKGNDIIRMSIEVIGEANELTNITVNEFIKSIK